MHRPVGMWVCEECVGRMCGVESEDMGGGEYSQFKGLICGRLPHISNLKGVGPSLGVLVKHIQ